MFRIGIAIVIVGLFQFSRVDCFKFTIAQDISKSRALSKTNWCYVEITEKEDVEVKVDIALSIPYADVYVYFANDQKEILKVKMRKTLEATFYEIPYKPVKEMTGNKTETIVNNNFWEVSGQFPKFWLPENSTKVSGTVVSADGRILNYYNIQNLKISFPDLMILEEYKTYRPN